nr:hypothetical protein [Tanacetum cinerariifolium]
MVACMERTDENAEFHQIVHFFTSSTIHYALTQIHAKVDGKTVRSDLHFNDEDGTVSSSFDTMLVPPVVKGEGSGQPSEPQPQSPTALPKQVLATVSKPQKTHTPRRTKRGRDTKIPQSIGPPKKVGDEPVYTREDERVVRAATNAASLETEQKSGNINKTRSTTTLNEPSPHETGSGSRPMRHVTTLGDKNAQTRFETASKQSYDPPLIEVSTSGSGEDSMEYQDDLADFVPPTPHDLPLSGGHTLGSDEGRPNINEFMNIYTQLSNMVLALEQFKAAQDLIIKRLRKKDKILEKKQWARTSGMKLFKIGTSKKKTLDKKNVSKQERDESNKTDELNLSDKGSGETKVFDYTTTAENDVNAAEPVSTAGDAVNAASVIPDVSAVGPSTSTIGDIFEDEMKTIADTLIAIRSTRPRITSVVIHNVKEEPRRATPLPTIQSQDKDKVKMMEPEPTSKNPIKAQIQRDAKIAQSKKRSRADHDKKSVKKQKPEEDDAEKEELRACLDIVSVDDIAINVESLATKYPIVDWKTHTLTENMMYYQIVRANGSSKNYKILTEMCDDFDRQDIIDLYRLVKK